MPRFALALAFATLPILAAANAPPPDHFAPCIGKLAGDPCFEAGCACVEVQDGCPGDAGACLSCERPGHLWCGPSSYSGPGSSGGCSTPGAASLAGLLALVLLVRRRGRPPAR